MMRQRYAIGFGLPFLLLIAQGFAPAQQPDRLPEQRAEPPEFDPSASMGIFFDDAFSEGLVGPRPDHFDVGPTSRPGGLLPGNTPTGPGEGAGGVYAWSEVISATTLEDTIKNMKLEVDQMITSPGRFASRDFRAARRKFSLLAVLFAIAAEYDGEVRWQEEGATARDLFAHTAANAKVGTIQVFNESRDRKEELSALVLGETIPLDESAERAANWEDVCDRTPLMQWLEALHTERVVPWTASEGEFQSHSEELVRDLELIAALAEVLTKESMEDAGDDDYDGYAERMKQAALEIRMAIELGNLPQAQAAAGEINKSCSECHEYYRG